MAEELRHAAGQATYEVHEVLDGDSSVELNVLFRCADYGLAVEFAFEVLGRRDPQRDGTVGGLQVVKLERGRSETVWTYTHSAQESRPDPTRQWGFDVTRRWQLPTAPVRPFGGRVYRRA
jgi:hypothetical protein